MLARNVLCFREVCRVQLCFETKIFSSSLRLIELVTLSEAVDLVRQIDFSCIPLIKVLTRGNLRDLNRAASGFS